MTRSVPGCRRTGSGRACGRSCGRCATDWTCRTPTARRWPSGSWRRWWRRRCPCPCENRWDAWSGSAHGPADASGPSPRPSPVCSWCWCSRPPVRAAVADRFGFGGVEVRWVPGPPGGSPVREARGPGHGVPLPVHEAVRRADCPPVAPEVLRGGGGGGGGEGEGQDGQVAGRPDGAWLAGPRLQALTRVDEDGTKGVRSERTAGPTPLWVRGGRMTSRPEEVRRLSEARRDRRVDDPSGPWTGPTGLGAVRTPGPLAACRTRSGGGPGGHPGRPAARAGGVRCVGPAGLGAWGPGRRQTLIGGSAAARRRALAAAMRTLAGDGAREARHGLKVSGS